MTKHVKMKKQENKIDNKIRSNKIQKILGEMPKGLFLISIILLIVITCAIILAIIVLPYPMGAGESLLEWILK